MTLSEMRSPESQKPLDLWKGGAWEQLETLAYSKIKRQTLLECDLCDHVIMLVGKEGKGCTFFSFSRIIWSFWCSIFFKVATSSFSWAMMTKWSVPGESSARSGEKLQQRTGKEPRHNPTASLRQGNSHGQHWKENGNHSMTHTVLPEHPSSMLPVALSGCCMECGRPQGLCVKLSRCIITDQTVKILFQTKELRTVIRELMKLDASTLELCSVLGHTAEFFTKWKQTFWQGGSTKEKQSTSKLNKQSTGRPLD